MRPGVSGLAGAAALAWIGVSSAGCVKLTVSDGGDGGEPGSNPSVVLVLTTGPTRLDRSIPDDERYDGAIGSMECVTLPFQDQGFTEVLEVELAVVINHPWVGDLVIKVASPGGTVTTVLNRPGLDEPRDASFDEGGDSSDLAATDLITFRDGEPIAAEDMGDDLQSADVICRDDHRCAYAPSPGRGPGTSLADFQGEDPAGDWQVCVADASDGDAGVLQRADLSLRVR